MPNSQGSKMIERLKQMLEKLLALFGDDTGRCPGCTFDCQQGRNCPGSGSHIGESKMTRLEVASAAGCAGMAVFFAAWAAIVATS